MDSPLVTSLVREVLAEKISAMFAERVKEHERAANQHVTIPPTSQPDAVPAVTPDHAVRSRVYIFVIIIVGVLVLFLHQ